jgi:hypothetical protein
VKPSHSNWYKNSGWTLFLFPREEWVSSNGLLSRTPSRDLCGSLRSGTGPSIGFVMLIAYPARSWAPWWWTLFACTSILVGGVQIGIWYGHLADNLIVCYVNDQVCDTLRIGL